MTRPPVARVNSRRGGAMKPASLIIFDTTLRDGEQAPGFALRVEEKLEFARKLDVLGVDVIEAGFPIASHADAESVRVISQAVRRPIVAALARCRADDIDCAKESLKLAERSRLHTFIATSDIHLKRKLRMSREQCLTAVTYCVKSARDFTSDVEFSAEDATRSDLDFLCRVIEAAIKAGATTINLPDTVGYCTPDEVGVFFKQVQEKVSNAEDVIFSAHCHDDLGLAVANSLAAIQAGCRQVECTINGVGERAGNAALEEIIMATRVRHDLLPYETRIQTKELYACSQLLTNLTHESVQANKAIVGRNAFAHEAGIHQDGMIKDRRTYEIMRPEDVGVDQTTLVIGKHSGRHAVQKRCEELGYQLSRLEVDRVYRRVMALADTKKTIDDGDVLEIVTSVQVECERYTVADA